MNDNDKELLNKIDNISFISDKNLDDMDFYELCYYMQTLNLVDSIGNEEVGEE